MAMTIKDIAELAGVSVGTVSKVLNDQGNVKESLRLRVQAVVDKLNYRPSSIARSFKKSETRTIGLIIPRIASQFYLQLTESVEKLVKAEGYRLFLANTGEDPEIEIGDLRTFAAMRVDGLLIATAANKDPSRITKELDAFDVLGIPVVVVSRRMDGAARDTVFLDHATGAFEAANYLFDRGHRTIGVLAAPAYSSPGIDFSEGYIRALADRGLPYHRDLIAFGNPDADLDRAGIRSMLTRQKGAPTALLVASSHRVLSVLEAIRDLSLRVPTDVSLISVGDATWFNFTDPPVSVLRVPAQELAEEANALLFDRIRGNREEGPRTVVIRPEMVERGSVRTLS